MIRHTNVTFFNPTFLYFLPLAALPFIIHLLGERKHRPYAFSSLKFLREIEQSSMQKLKWRQWLILLARALAIAMLVLALGRPLFRGSFGVAESGLLLIDRSFSTQIDPGFQEKSAELIRHFESWEVFEFDEHSSGDSLQRRILDHLELYSNAETPLILISDFQDNAQTAEICSMLEDLALRRYLLPIRKNEANLAVSGLNLLPEYREDELMSLAIHSSASELYDAPASVGIRINGRAAGRVNMDEQGFGVFRFDPGDAEYIRCIAQGAEDAYPEDNVRYRVVKPYSQIRILDVAGHELAGYQREALAAMEGIQLEGISPEMLPATDLNKYDMLIISDPGSLPKGQKDRILRFSAQGPLLLIAGEKTGEWLDGSWEERNLSPGFVAFETPETEGQSFRIRSYYRSGIAFAETIWRLSNGDPLLVRNAPRQYFMFSPFVFDRNEMGLSPYFTRVLRQFILNALQWEIGEYETGDALVLDRPRFSVRSPGGEIFQMQGPFRETHTPGFYILESEDTRRELAVNIPVAETLQRQIPQSACKGIWIEESDYSVLRDSIRGREASALFFLLAAAFLLFEMLLTGKGERTASWKKS